MIVFTSKIIEIKIGDRFEQLCEVLDNAIPKDLISISRTISLRYTCLCGGRQMGEW